jgi:rare lipoprotein A (peptidoglycan hydrolase)
MKTLRRDIVVPLAAVLTLGLAAPALAQEQAPTGGTEATVGQPGLTVRPGALLQRTLSIRGQTDAGDAGRNVRIEVLVPNTDWRPVAQAVVGSDGVFAATWRTDTLGKLQLRAIVERPSDSAQAAAAPLMAQVTVFKPHRATWYGPGFFGKRTACGMKLTRRTLGVAHKTLPCGTEVELYHRGKTVTVPVIDRGPFRKGVEWDLTHATAQALGVESTVRVGALAPEPRPLSRRRAKRP